MLPLLRKDFNLLRYCISFKMYLTGRSPAKKIMPASYMYVMYYVGISCMTFTNVSNGKKVYLIPFTFCHQRL